MDDPVLTAARWRMGEYLFVEYLEGDGILIDLGPFPSDPNDEQVDQAYTFLEKAKGNFLTLGELEWSLDLDKLTASFPELKPFHLHGTLSHPAAFETTSRPMPRRFFDKGLPVEGIYFLRISFQFRTDDVDTGNSLDRPESSAPPALNLPKFIS